MLFLTVYTLFKKELHHRHSPGIFPEQLYSSSYQVAKKERSWAAEEKGTTKELVFIIFQMSTKDIFQCVELQSN